MLDESSDYRSDVTAVFRFIGKDSRWMLDESSDYRSDVTVVFRFIGKDSR